MVRRRVMPARAGGKGYRMSKEEIIAAKVLPQEFARDIEDTGTADDGVSVCGFVSWLYGPAIGPNRLGRDNLGRHVLEAYRDRRQVWRVCEGEELPSDPVEGPGQFHGVWRFVEAGQGFERFDELCILADAVIGAALGDEAARRWLCHHGFAMFLPVERVAA